MRVSAVSSSDCADSADRRHRVEVVDASASGTLTHSSIIMPRMPELDHATANALAAAAAQEVVAAPNATPQDPATPMITAHSSTDGDTSVFSPAQSLVSLDADDWEESDGEEENEGFIVIDDSTDDDA